MTDQALHAALATLNTPAALLDGVRLQHNIDRLQRRTQALGVRLRPHVKTSKCAPVVQAQRAAGAQGITVSTLKEAAQFAAIGITDISYAVGIASAKLPAVLALRRQGVALKILTDNADTAAAIADFGRRHGERFEVLIEIDCDGQRGGIAPESGALLAVGQALHAGGLQLAGVLTHAGGSYACSTPEALAAFAEQERAACVRAAERLRAAGLPCPVVSVGATPTALSAAQLAGVTEVRAGVYVFFDLVLCNIGVCRIDELALSVLSTVIGHQRDKGWALIDAGWMALSRDRGTQAQAVDYGYGQVCDLYGVPLPGCTVSGANQEHGIVSFGAAPGIDIARRLPVGTLLRILPNHACATAAQFDHYQVIGADASLAAWPRFNGW